MNCGRIMFMEHDFLRPLYELVAVAKTGHVTAAAAELGLAQPTLSRSLARLSKSVGAPLVLPSGRGIALTRHGQVLAAAAARAIADVEEAVRGIRAEVDPDSGSVRLGFQHVLGAELVTRVLRDFHAEHPRVALQLAEGGSAHLAADLAAGGLDLALIAVLEPLNVPGAEGRVLGAQPLRVLLPSGHPRADAPSLKLADLAGEPFVTMAEGFGMRTITDRLRLDAGVLTRPAYTCEDLSTAAGLVAAGLGFTVVPARMRFAGTVEVALDSGSRRAERIVQLLWSPAAMTSAPVRALRAALEASVPRYL
jgi:LysR family transcriptional activator of glutamate synthase operon